MTLAAETCAICQIHGAVSTQTSYEIGRGALWVLRHHPDPAPLLGWLLLDSARHLGGPADFNPEEAAAWGLAVQHASALVKELTGCDRVYAIAFGEGAPHLHLHLIPRFASDPTPPHGWWRITTGLLSPGSEALPTLATWGCWWLRHAPCGVGRAKKGGDLMNHHP